MRYFVESYGCTMNRGEGEQFSRRMSELGHSPADSPECADIVVLNTCTVVDTTEKKMLKRMSELRRAGKRVVVTGCMAKVQPGRIALRLPDSLIIPPDRYSVFSSAVGDTYGHSEPVADIPYGISGIIPIAQGCMGRCTYCITRLARGRLVSSSEEEVLRRFKDMLENGVREILVTAQDTACYGTDRGTSLDALLRRMLDFPGDYRIRIGMMNPDSLERISDGLLDAMADPRVYRFLHIPVQSGSDSVLERMGRRYTAGGFMSMAGSLRDTYPDLSIATDLITGFPGETDEDHRRSMDLVRRLRADTLNITRFSPRPGTLAAGMEAVGGNVSKDRSRELTDLKNLTEYDVNRTMVGREYRVLATENGKPGTVICRTDNYRPVAVHGDIPLGTFLDVRITGGESTYLRGEETRRARPSGPGDGDGSQE